NCKGTLIDLSSPKVMGVINLNADSFYSKSRVLGTQPLLTKVSQMLEEGADFIDLGFMSSKPGSEISDPDEESLIICKAIETILDHFPETLISIDTIHSSVAKSGLEGGAAIINDISAGSHDDQMWQIVKEFSAPYIMMHMRGNPQTMLSFTEYDDVVLDVLRNLATQKKAAIEFGLKDVIIDPGFGFAKTIDQNFELLNKLAAFQMIEAPILVGISRKSMIYKTLETSPEESLTGTIALNFGALERGANILRVHDVKEAKETITLFQKLNEFN
ncbi:MAG TPA: dihydropteroate synthase, partial [Saprospiraceae bacterium]|nr:dihydropteroate synthase [Saprospiraceae bacterium]